jgi:hypothetical protein
VFNVHSSTEDKKYSTWEKQDSVMKQLLKYYTTTKTGDFNANVNIRGIFKQTTGKYSLQKTSK